MFEKFFVTWLQLGYAAAVLLQNLPENFRCFFSHHPIGFECSCGRGLVDQSSGTNAKSGVTDTKGPEGRICPGGSGSWGSQSILWDSGAVEASRIVSGRITASCGTQRTVWAEGHPWTGFIAWYAVLPPLTCSCLFQKLGSPSFPVTFVSSLMSINSFCCKSERIVSHYLAFRTLR